MNHVKSRQLGWMPWAFDQTVEYQITDDFLRIRRWEHGALRTSAWTRWELSTDETVRKALRELAWERLPRHTARAARKPDNAGWRRNLTNWFRDHFIAG